MRPQATLTIARHVQPPSFGPQLRQLLNRGDASLTVALIISAVVLFHQPFRSLLTAVNLVEDSLHLDLLPALVILVFTVACQQYGKRMKTAAHVETLAAKVEESDRLLQLSAVIGGTLDEATLRVRLYEALPMLCGERPFWLMVRRRPGWDDFLPDVQPPSEDVLAVLEQWVAPDSDEATLAELRHGKVVAGELCFRIYRPGSLVAFLGLRNDPPMDPLMRESVAAVAAMISIALNNVAAFDDIRQRASIDELTGCLTRATGIALLSNELKRSRRSGRPLSLLLIDVDDFKSINDTYGHLVGDHVLQTIGREIVEAVLRTTDSCCRYGGDEFLVILPDTHHQGAQLLARRVREHVRQMAFREDDIRLDVTITVGAATVDDGDTDVRALIRRADDALYDGKRERGEHDERRAFQE